MRARLLTGLLLAALPLAVAAQETESQEPDADIEELVILGIRPGVLERLPTAATDQILTAERAGENQSLPDLLTGVPGLWVRRLGGRADDVEISIRGSAANQVLLTLDGVPINSLLSGVGDAAGVCLPLIERIDITRGTGGARYGSGAVAGVVDLRPHAEAPGSTQARASGGAFDTYEASLRHSNRLGELDVQAGYCGLTTNGDFEFARPTQEVNGIPIRFDPDEATRRNNDRERHGAHLGLQHPLLGGELRLTDVFEFEKGGAPGFDSGTGVDAGQALEARKRDWSQLGILAWEGAAGALGDALELRAHHRFEFLDFRDPMPALGPPIDFTARAHTFGGAARDAWEIEIGGARQTLALFADGVYERLSSRSALDETRNRGGGGAEAVLRGWGERVLVSAALRLDGADGFSSEWLPSLGVALTPMPWIRLRANLGRAYRVATLNELFLPDQGFIRGNPTLAPEDALNFDVGAELELEAFGPLRNVQLRGAWFRREIDETIVWVQISPTTVAPINTGDATADGFELSLAFAFTDWIRARASHTSLDSRRDATRKRLPGQPRHETHGRLELGLEERFKLVGEVQRTGTILVNEGGGRKLPARTVWNASASVNLARLPQLEALPLARALWLFFEINNIGDEAVRDSLAFPQPGRNASVGVEGRW